LQFKIQTVSLPSDINYFLIQLTINKLIMKKIFLLVLSALLSVSAIAHDRITAKDYRNWSIMLKGGLTRGDYPYQLGGMFGNDNKEWTGVYGLEIERTFNQLWGLSADVNIFNYHGAFHIPAAATKLSAQGVNGLQKGYGIFVSGEAIESALLGSINLSNLLINNRSERARRFNIYFRAGLGLSFYKTDQIGVMAQFTKDKGNSFVNAEGEAARATNRDQSFDKDYDEISFVLPLEMQFEYNISRSLALGVIFGHRWHSSKHFGFPELPQHESDGLDQHKKSATNGNHVTFYTGQASLRYKFRSRGNNNHIRNFVPELREDIGLVKAYDDAPIIARIDGLERRLGDVEQAMRDHEFIMQQLLENKVSFRDNESLLIVPIVEFAIDSHTIKDNFSADLDVLANALRQQPNNFIVHVAGHTDSTGSTAHNERLAQNRANAVKAYLEARGVQQRIEATGFGKRAPIATNNTDDGRQRNRRVEIRFSNR